MKHINIERRGFLGTILLLAALLVVPIVQGDDDEVTVRWDIVSFNFATTPIQVSEGGPASALALGGAKLTLTGSGTFQPGDSSEVTGGGTWQLFPPGASIPSSSGTYKVTRLVRWDQAPGVLPAVADLIGNSAEASAGQAILLIKYSDGTRGIVVVGCRLVGTPGIVIEGITATKHFASFWNHLEPAPGVNANRTLFHVTAGDND